MSYEPKPIDASGVRLTRDILNLSENLEACDFPTLLAYWQARQPDQWPRAPEVYQRMAGRMIQLGEPLAAYDVLTEGLQQFPTGLRLRQLLALALARSGAASRANAILRELRHEPHPNDQALEETLGILASTHKDLWAQAADPAERERQLRQACEAYAEAYRLTKGYWTGINAAALALLLGRGEEAVALAREVRGLCHEALERISKEGSGDPYWPLATLGEAALLLGDCPQAELYYSQAAAAAGRRLGDLAGARKQARLLLEVMECDRERIEKCFRCPRVVAFVGHMIDQPDRASPRFPARAEGAVRAAVRERLEKLDGRLGYASAACGSDILFLETLLELGGEAHIVLPYHKDQFRKDSVEIIPGADWGLRYERVLDRAAQVLAASEQRLEGGSVSYEYANAFLHGLAGIRAQQLDTELVPLAVWDGRPGDGPGGTSSTIERWRSLGYHVEWINLAQILSREYPELVSAPGPALPPRKPAARAATQIMAILFADATHFSKLSEQEVPLFVRHFMGAVGDLTAHSPYPPVLKNTWGDGLYLVFHTVEDAGRFALDLSERIGSINWAEKGLPKQLTLRIALHAGPVYSCCDPVTQHATYMGAHVNRAARIEPITPPGQVYASQAFAALAAAERVNAFRCEYVGTIPLTKAYGALPTYHLRRSVR